MKLTLANSTISKYRKRILFTAVFVVFACPAFAVTPFKIKDIRIEGIGRTEAGTVFSYLPLKVGETVSDEKVTDAVKTLYKTGFFSDVKIGEDNQILVVELKERPIISEVAFSGTKEFEKDKLVKALKNIGVGESRVFDRASVDRAEQELKHQYLARGYYGVEIQTQVSQEDRNRVKVEFKVNEGKAAYIKTINFVGNKVYSDSVLRSLLKVSTQGIFTWISKADQYSKQKLTGSLDVLRTYYLNHGYLEMQVLSTQTMISPDRKNIFITINISEGKKFTVSDIKLEGEMFGREKQFESLVTFKKGDIYSGDQLKLTVKNISEMMGDFGYAFATVMPTPKIDQEKAQVGFTFIIDPGKRVYVRKVSITGNTKTKDEVIRRELRQLEDSWYDGSMIRLSRDRVDRLGYFNDVNIETPEVSGVPDQVDVNMNVVEKPTGNFQVGAGYSASDKLILSASIKQANFAGTGNTLGFEVNTSKINRTFALSQVNPYFTDDGVSRSIEIYLRDTSQPFISTGTYNISTKGVKLGFGVPFTEIDTVFFSVGVDRTGVDTNSTSPSNFKQYVKDFGSDPINGIGSAITDSLPLTVAWQRDSRDSALAPNSGRYQRANFEFSALGDLKYYRAIYEQQYFKPITKVITLMMRGEIDYGAGFGGKPYPVFKNFYAGGIGTVRGYDASSLGPTDATTRDPLGGASRALGSLQFMFPFPGAGDDRTLRWFAFVDGGNVSNGAIQWADLRYSTGLGLTWLSPIGPIAISYGKALNAKSTDRLRTFDFQLGGSF